MKKTTLKQSNNLTKRLAQYSALSVAIAGVADANGQIVYTDIADVTIDSANARAVLDLNNDATGEYLFGAGAGDNFAFIFPASSSMASAYNSNAFVGFVSGAYAYPSNLSAGQAISSANPTFAMQRGDFNYSSCGYPNSQFCDGMDGFIGLHFYIGANLHYGWARIQVAASGASIILKDYAYESTPDTPIDAGQTLSVTDFDQAHNFVISFTDRQVTIASIVDEAKYRIISINGKVVMNGSTNSETEIIDMSNLSSGIYIVEITDGNEQRIQRKKIVLN